MTDSEAARQNKSFQNKGYAQAYRGLGKQLILLGFNFDTGKRNVSEWKAETVVRRGL